MTTNGDGDNEPRQRQRRTTLFLFLNLQNTMLHDQYKVQTKPFNHSRKKKHQNSSRMLVEENERRKRTEKEEEIERKTTYSVANAPPEEGIDGRRNGRGARNAEVSRRTMKRQFWKSVEEEWKRLIFKFLGIKTLLMKSD